MHVQGWEAIPSVELVGVSGEDGEMARWRECGERWGDKAVFPLVRRCSNERHAWRLSGT